MVDASASKSAMNLCDKHVPKMLLETCQMLSTAVRKQLSDLKLTDEVYKSAYPNHPMTKWVGNSYLNFMWALEHGEHLAKEYSFRFNKIHKSERIIHNVYKLTDLMKKSYDFDKLNFTETPQCMPDKYKTNRTITAYRDYYFHEKKYFATWNRGRDKPNWFKRRENLHGKSITE